MAYAGFVGSVEAFVSISYRNSTKEELVKAIQEKLELLQQELSDINKQLLEKGK